MTASVGDYVLDHGLDALDSLANQVWICNAEPSTYAQATTLYAGSPDTGTYALGYKEAGGSPAGSVVGSPYTGSPDLTGRAVDTIAITDGVVAVNGNATHWAIVDSANSRLLAHGALTATVAVAASGSFALPAFTIRLPNQ